LTVIGTGGTEKGRDNVAQQGAHHVLDHHSPGYTDQILELTEGAGVNIILEMLANVNLGERLRSAGEVWPGGGDWQSRQN
jgi:NADPH2:quinone reductase